MEAAARARRRIPTAEISQVRRAAVRDVWLLDGPVVRGRLVRLRHVRRRRRHRAALRRLHGGLPRGRRRGGLRGDVRRRDDRALRVPLAVRRRPHGDETRRERRLPAARRRGAVLRCAPAREQRGVSSFGAATTTTPARRRAAPGRRRRRRRQLVQRRRVVRRRRRGSVPAVARGRLARRRRRRRRGVVRHRRPRRRRHLDGLRRRRVPRPDRRRRVLLLLRRVRRRCRSTGRLVVVGGHRLGFAVRGLRRPGRSARHRRDAGAVGSPKEVVVMLHRVCSCCSRPVLLFPPTSILLSSTSVVVSPSAPVCCAREGPRVPIGPVAPRSTFRGRWSSDVSSQPRGRKVAPLTPRHACLSAPSPVMLVPSKKR
mmetsp:Transcript_13207/g.52935  ORF Transcript_13207/g.52935 Transcript_13207/m.52935 type:complete len:370 (-) Transcript_13207:1091-2200(-)